MTTQQQIFALIVSALVFAVVIDLVRRRKLREEYSVLWLGTSTIMFFLVLRYDWLVALTSMIGAALPTTTLFLCSIIFLMLLMVQFSIRISRLDNQVKNLSQENALLRIDLEKVTGPAEARGDGESSITCDEKQGKQA